MIQHFSYITAQAKVTGSGNNNLTIIPIDTSIHNTGEIKKAVERYFSKHRNWYIVKTNFC